jgi:hypothetical protein
MTPVVPISPAGKRIVEVDLSPFLQSARIVTKIGRAIIDVLDRPLHDPVRDILPLLVPIDIVYHLFLSVRGSAGFYERPDGPAVEWLHDSDVPPPAGRPPVCLFVVLTAPAELGQPDYLPGSLRRPAELFEKALRFVPYHLGEFSLPLLRVHVVGRVLREGRLPA